jgi:hypothetical protein
LDDQTTRRKEKEMKLGERRNSEYICPSGTLLG